MRWRPAKRLSPCLGCSWSTLKINAENLAVVVGRHPWGGRVQWLQMGKSLCLKYLPLKSTFHVATLRFLKPQSNHGEFPT